MAQLLQVELEELSKVGGHSDAEQGCLPDKGKEERFRIVNKA